jgi:hypothetical protein
VEKPRISPRDNLRKATSDVRCGLFRSGAGFFGLVRRFERHVLFNDLRDIFFGSFMDQSPSGQIILLGPSNLPDIGLGRWAHEISLQYNRVNEFIAKSIMVCTPAAGCLGMRVWASTGIGKVDVNIRGPIEWTIAQIRTCWTTSAA